MPKKTTTKRKITKATKTKAKPKKKTIAKKSVAKTKTSKAKVTKTETKPKIPKYNIWRKKSVYGPLYRRLESYKQAKMHEEEKLKVKERIAKEDKIEEEKTKAEIKKVEKDLAEEEKKLREKIMELNERKKSLSRDKKKVVKLRNKRLKKKIKYESEEELLFEPENESDHEFEVESSVEKNVSLSSESEEIEIETSGKKLKKNKIYIYKNGKLVLAKLSSKPKKAKKKKTKKILFKQMKEQQKRMDSIDVKKERYCLVDYWEDTNDKIDIELNKKRGKIHSSRRKRPGTYNFTLQKALTSVEYKIKICSDLNISCSCPDWKTCCKNLGIMCKHIYYIMKYVIKYPITDIKDNQVQDKLVFYDNLEYIKLDYHDEVTKTNANNNKCPICYGDLRIKNGWTWTVDWNNAVVCPDCSKPIHRDCAKVWLEKSDNKNCVYCRSNRFQHVV
jgi:hypothetical protein